MRSISRGFFLSILTVSLLIAWTSCDQRQASGKKSRDLIQPQLILPPPGPVPTEEKERIKAACQAWYDTVLAPRGFSGEMLVAKNGNIIFEQYAGTCHIPGNDPITDSTSLHIASVSKTFTAMAVLKLVQDGKLSLDDEFSKYFPAFNYPGVTVRTLLNHRSGLPNYTHFLENMGWDKTRMASNEDVLDFLIANKAAMVDVNAPDTRFTYCNTNYTLLALLIEKITGTHYGDYLKQTFFNPLQMTHSFVFSMADSNRVVPSYNWRGKPEPLNFLDQVYGDKNIYTTVRDLLVWDRALRTNLIFRPETLQEAYTPYSNERPGIKNYGLGWRMLNYPGGQKIIYHNGWWHGSNASFTRLLNDSATIIVIGNKFTRAIYHARILASIFGNYFNTGEEEDAEASNAAGITADSLTEKKAGLPTGKTKKHRLTN